MTNTPPASARAQARPLQAPTRWAPPGRAAARWRGALLLVPLVVGLHALVVLGAWRAAERPAVRAEAAPPPTLAQAPAPPVRELRVVAPAPRALAPAPGGDGATTADRAPEVAPVTAHAAARPALAAPGAATATAPAARPVAPAAGVAALPVPSPSQTGALTGAGTAAPAPIGADTPETTPAAAGPAEATAAGERGPTTALTAVSTAPRSPAPTRPDPARSAPSDAPVPTPVATASSAATGPPAAPAPAPLPASLPVYRGEAPPPATLHFSLRRGAVGGRGHLEWRPGPEGYELTLQATVLGVRALQQTSRGRWDLGGLAPERFVDTRRGREARAANFRHDVGLISYSGPSETYPLLRGAQDRLSWMLQLPAVMQANPALRQVGTELRMFVTGARADADVWAFRVLSHERIGTPVGEVSGALHLQRLPRKEHDTQADIWLDPARHHLPVRVRLQSGDDVFDLVLDRIEGG